MPYLFWQFLLKKGCGNLGIIDEVLIAFITVCRFHIQRAACIGGGLGNLGHIFHIAPGIIVALNVEDGRVARPAAANEGR